MEAHHDITHHAHVIEQADVLEGTGHALVIDFLLAQALQLLAI